MEERWRAQITLDLTAISENLNLAKSSQLRLRHKALFKYAAGLKKQRNWIAHSYELPDSRLSWEMVWKTVNFKFKDVLLPQLNHAINREEKDMSVSKEGYKDPENDQMK
jgi:hypothetical protein